MRSVQPFRKSVKFVKKLMRSYTFRATVTQFVKTTKTMADKRYHFPYKGFWHTAIYVYISVQTRAHMILVETSIKCSET